MFLRLFFPDVSNRNNEVPHVIMKTGVPTMLTYFNEFVLHDVKYILPKFKILSIFVL